MRKFTAGLILVHSIDPVFLYLTKDRVFAAG